MEEHVLVPVVIHTLANAHVVTLEQVVKHIQAHVLMHRVLMAVHVSQAVAVILVHVHVDILEQIVRLLQTYARIILA
jgi:hypothetical protein